jgi:hypothetical protein
MTETQSSSKVMTHTGKVHLAKMVRLGKSMVEAPRCTGTRNLHYAFPVPAETPLTCSRCQSAAQQDTTSNDKPVSA